MNRHKISIVYIFLFILFVANNCFAADIPERIISLSPPITESLYDLGVGDKVVGVTVFCQYPGQVKTKEKIGTILEPNIEKIALLSPDLVLGTMEGNRRQTIEKLRSLGIRVHVFKQSQSFQDIYSNFIELGIIVGKEKKATQIVSGIKEKIGLISDKLKDTNPVSVFWEVGARPLVTVNRDTAAGDFIKLSKGINIFAEAKLRYPRVSREEIVRIDPDVIILVTMGDVTKEEKKFWRGFSDLSAVKSKRIYTVEPYLVCSPTPLKLAEGIRVVAGLLHPEVFQ